jgi:hypothetical protein
MSISGSKYLFDIIIVVVTRVLRLLHLSTEIQQAVVALGDPMKARVVGARTLRFLVKLPAEDQQHRITNLIGRNGT